MKKRTGYISRPTADTRTSSRRQWISSRIRNCAAFGFGTSLAAGLISGCTEAPESKLDSTPDDLPKVPLRLLMVGNTNDANTVRRGWSAVSDQPLDINVIGDDGRLALDNRTTIFDAAAKCDLVWFPHCLIADLVAKELIAPVRLGENTEIAFASVRNGLATYAGDEFAAPIGPAVPTIMSVDPVDPPRSWAEYDQLVSTSWTKGSAEPTAPGWAAMMFLWRCAGQVERWLFDPNDFHPVIQSQDYVHALSQMKQTCQRYSKPEWTAAEIFAGIGNGGLDAGITFPHPTESETPISSSIAPLPSTIQEDEPSVGPPILFDVMTPLIGIASNCRQTAASRVFLEWILGGEGSQSVRNQIPGVFRVLNVESTSRGTAATEAATEYDKVRSKILQQPITSDAMTVLNAGAYYRALDAAVRECLASKLSPQESLASVSEQWQKLTKQTGRENQLIALRRAKGFRS